MATGRFLIYGLVDARTGEVRYIGKSANGLTRPRKHLQPAQLTRRCHRNSWLRGLLKAGGRCEVRVLEELPSREWLNDAERFWIAQGRGLCWPLTNMTPGGDGNAFMPGNQYARGNRLSAETRARMSRARMGNRYAAGPQTTEERARTSAALKAFWADPTNRQRMLEARRKARETNP